MKMVHTRDMLDRSQSIFAVAFLLLGSAAVVMPVSSGIFGTFDMPSADLLDAFKPVQKTVGVSSSVSLPPPDLVAASALIYDPIRDTVIFEKTSDEKFGIASVTKIMTALVAYNHAGERERISIGPDAVRTEGSEGDLAVGEHFLLRDLITIMLISSSNDAAAAIAEHIGMLHGALNFEESQIVFVRMMNEYARAQGLTGTAFQNATGLDADEDRGIASNTSTARDIALLMKHVFHHPMLGNAYTAVHTTVYSEEDIPHTVSTTHELLATASGVIGGKTGFTDAAGGALVTIAEVPFGHVSIIVILGSTRDGRFTDTTALLDWLRNKT